MQISQICIPGIWKSDRKIYFHQKAAVRNIWVDCLCKKTNKCLDEPPFACDGDGKTSHFTQSRVKTLDHQNWFTIKDLPGKESGCFLLFFCKQSKMINSFAKYSRCFLCCVNDGVAMSQRISENAANRFCRKTFWHNCKTQEKLGKTWRNQNTI